MVVRPRRYGGEPMRRAMADGTADDGRQHGAAPSGDDGWSASALQRDDQSPAEGAGNSRPRCGGLSGELSVLSRLGRDGRRGSWQGAFATSRQPRLAISNADDALRFLPLLGN